MKKKTIMYAIALFATMALFSCSKNDNAGTTPNPSSNWSFDGQSFKGTTTVFTNNSLLSTDQMSSSSSDVIAVDFWSPPVAGTYRVIQSGQGMWHFGEDLQCWIESSGTAYPALYSAGGGTVTIKISGGKINATFNDVPMTDVKSENSTTISGTLVEQ